MPTKILALCGGLPLFDPDLGANHGEANLRETLTTMAARLLPLACLASPLRSTGITEQGILDAEHAAEIRRALTLLASGAPRA